MNSIRPKPVQLKFTFVAISVLSAIVSGPTRVDATEFHVTPAGTPTGNGSLAQPWELQTALSHPKAVKPGDVIWLHGGTYRGSFFSQLQGEKGKRILVKQVPGERAIIDIEPNKQGVGFFAYGQWTRFQGFEITCTNPKRRTKIKGSWPADVRRGSVECRGSHIQFVNLLVHDLGNGFGFWAEGAGGEITGCLIYNNGWGAPDRGHGHAIYAQNKTGKKLILDNIIFNQFGDGINVYGSPKATLKNFLLEGNVSFHNGSLYKPGSRMNHLHVGGECPLQDVVVRSNFIYGGGIQIGYAWGKINDSVKVLNNYLTGGAGIYYQNHLVFEGNTVISEGPLVRLTITNRDVIKKYSINRNSYYLKSTKYGAFAIAEGRGRSLTVEAWQKQGFDQDSQIRQGQPEGVRVFVRPNKYEIKRAHIVIYNWDRRDSVDMDLSKVLKQGDQFRIVSAQNFFGPTISEGQYDGNLVPLSMKPTTAAQPVGMPAYPLPATMPDFGVFVVLPQ